VACCSVGETSFWIDYQCVHVFGHILIPLFQDELEGTLRGHIGLIEEALDRLEGKATEADREKKM
jgi:hypothetical protein